MLFYVSDWSINRQTGNRSVTVLFHVAFWFEVCISIALFTLLGIVLFRGLIVRRLETFVISLAALFVTGISLILSVDGIGETSLSAGLTIYLPPLVTLASLYFVCRKQWVARRCLTARVQKPRSSN